MTNIQFYNENCFDTMARMNDNNEFVDIILTSPPYNTARVSQTEKSMENYNNRYDVHLDNMTDDEYSRWTIDLFNAYNSVLSKNGVILYNMSYASENPNIMWNTTSDIIRNTCFMVADCIIWKKKSALPNNTSKNKLTRITEFVFVICRKSEFKTFNSNKKVTSQNSKGQKYYENIFNFIEAPNNDGSCKLNKATFSSDLCLKLLEIYANNDSVVYDSFMGTGTTAVACLKYNNGGIRKNNIKCIGSEISEKQVEYSKERISKVKF